MDERKPKAIGERLVRLRTMQEPPLNTADFARSLHMSYNRVNNWEQGVSRPDTDAALTIADTYNVTLDWIFTGDTKGLTTAIRDQLYPRARAV